MQLSRLCDAATFNQHVLQIFYIATMLQKQRHKERENILILVQSKGINLSLRFVNLIKLSQELSV